MSSTLWQVSSRVSGSDSIIRNHHCNSAKSNMFSAVQHPQPIEAYISKEVAAGRIIGPMSAPREVGAPVVRD